MGVDMTHRLPDLLGIELPVIQAPMAGVDSPTLAAAVSESGGLGSLACALLTPEQVKESWRIMRGMTTKPLNLNFFCHAIPDDDAEREHAWRMALAPYYRELDINPDSVPNVPLRMPFDDSMCAAVEEIRPEIVSFHFGLPSGDLLQRIKAVSAVIVSSATTVEEALWLEANGCDIVIAQGIEAGGHRGMFLTDDLTTQQSTATLTAQIIDAVSVPVIAAGGIGSPQNVAHMLSLGAIAAQIGTAYLFCPEARVSPFYLSRLTAQETQETAITNLYSGRPARGITTRFMREMGPMSDKVPPFPFAARGVAPLRQKSEATGSSDFAQLWAGSNFATGRIVPAGDLTRTLAGLS